MFPDYSVTYVPGLYRQLSNERCSWQAQFGCDFRRNGDCVLVELGR